MKVEDGFEIKVNKWQTKIDKELMESLPDEVGEQLLDFIDNVPYIQRLISPDRKRAKDLPRDGKGRIIVDLANPHILEDMDYFRSAARFYEENGCYTFLTPSKNPNSAYSKWFHEEKRRCREGYVRQSDGEWVTGYMYYFINYCPMMVTKTTKGSKKAGRVEGFPEVWEGIYWRFHYIWQAREAGKHAIELARRGCGKSYSLAAIMSHNFLLGENEEVRQKTTTVLVASNKEYLSSKDGTLTKFVPMIDFVEEKMDFSKARIFSSLQNMMWRSGYIDSKGREKGQRNNVMGLSVKDDEDKIRGKRGYLLFEEMGNFPNLLGVYDTARYGVEDGDYTMGIIYLVGTANNKESNFESAKKLLYNTSAYNIHGIENVYDKKNQGKATFGYFFPSYVNRKGCYNEDGVSDVVKALVQTLMRRYKEKKGADPRSVLGVIAEQPITPAEAIIKVKDAYFPVAQLSERLRQIDADPKAFDDVYVGQLVFNGKGDVEFVATDDVPIRKYGVDNSTVGALEIYEMPEKVKDNDGTMRVPYDRYCIGHDPVDNDQAESTSLASTFVLDLFTDRIVAEYTGRQQFADDGYEVLRKLAIFYNAKVLYEAHPYDQKVPVPDKGFVQWGDIKIGDKLFAPNGKIVTVKDIPMDGYDDIYRIRLADGRSVEASSGHIWKVNKINTKKSFELNTVQLYKEGVLNRRGQHSFFIQESGAVDFAYRDVPVNPYAFGLLLAEGAFTKLRNGEYESREKHAIQFSACNEDGEFYKSVLPYDIKHIERRGASWCMCIDDIDKKLDSLGLLSCDSNAKFIPEVYLHNDFNTRIELLRGIMDGGGCAVKRGASIFVTTSYRLSEDIKELCRSLGMKAYNDKGRKSCDFTVGTGKVYHRHESYRVAIATEKIIFKLPRKKEKQHVYQPFAKGSKASAILYKTAISSIEFIGRKKCKCVTVDSADGLYLIGDYVVTHNCNKKGCYAYFKKMNSVFMLADTPQYLRDKQIIKYSSFGSNSKGVNATAAINNYADRLTRDWLLKPVNIINNEGEEATLPNLYTIRSRGLLEELIAYDTERNFDRIRSLGMAMLYREGVKARLGSNSIAGSSDATGHEEDDYFTRNYDAAFVEVKRF